MNRRYLTIALLAFVGFTMVLIFTRVAEAKCFAPRISVSATEGARGTAVTVTGERFFAVCHDTDGDIGKPMTGAKNIKIFLKQGDRSTLLATLDADSKLLFSTVVTIPRNADLGMAIIVAEADAYAHYERRPLCPQGQLLPGCDTDRPSPVVFEVIASGQQ